MFNLEDTINELEGAFKEISTLRKSLLIVALEPFNALYQKDKDGKRMYEHMEKKDKEELIYNLKNDIIPMFEENKFEDGVTKAKKILEDLEK
jgi:hypothetical protein